MKKLYLLPGLMTDERLWSKFDLKDYELVHIPIPLENDFDLVCEKLDEYFLEDKINLLGFSFGSYLAAYYAIKNPNKINKLFLLAGSASFLNEKEIQRRKNILIQMQNFGFKSLSSKQISSMLEKQDDKYLINLIKSMFCDLGLEVYKKQMELSFKREDISLKLSFLSLPIKIFYSSKDKLFDYKALAKIIKKKNEKIILFEKQGSSHFIPLEYPKTLAKEIKIFFDD